MEIIGKCVFFSQLFEEGGTLVLESSSELLVLLNIVLHSELNLGRGPSNHFEFKFNSSFFF